MATVIGIRCAEGTVLAADRRVTSDDAVTSDGVRRVFEYDDAGAAVVGGVGAIEEFDRRFGTELDRSREESDDVHIDRIAQVASELTGELGLDGLVVGLDSNGDVGLREVGSDGLVLASDVTALGSGASVAFGPLEQADTDRGLDDVEALARETLSIVAQRDPDTGTDIDVVRFENGDD
ncbi:20S proteasome subunit A/B [Haladaptatus sp.]|uniref:20S proteasome subunit A/B n=1 Tax=Haladaptatus sp. TaxID=1973141 RepID=UPI003C345E79